MSAGDELPPLNIFSKRHKLHARPRSIVDSVNVALLELNTIRDAHKRMTTRQPVNHMLQT